AMIAPSTTAPTRAPTAYELTRARKFEWLGSPGASLCIVRSSAAAAADPSVESGSGVSTSFAVRSMVGGRRRGVLSGSLVIRSPGQATDSRPRPARRHGIVRGTHGGNTPGRGRTSDIIAP